jgi:hypothetical protein
VRREKHTLSRVHVALIGSRRNFLSRLPVAEIRIGGSAAARYWLEDAQNAKALLVQDLPDAACIRFF